MKKLFDISKIQRAINTPIVWGVILIGLSVPISVAFDNVLLALILLGALFSLAGIANVAMLHPVARVAMCLFLVLFVGLFYGVTPIKEGLVLLAKYKSLAFIPIFIFVLSNDQLRRIARHAFIFSMAITLLVSYLIGLKILPIMPWMNSWTLQSNPAIFHSHITQNNMMAFAIFLALLELRDASNRGKKLAWAIFSLLASVNILFMVQGRTGYLILFLLFGWFVWTTVAREMKKRGRNFGWKQGALIVVILGSVATSAYLASTRLHDRVAQVVSQFQGWEQQDGKTTSTEQRLDFYANSVKIVQQHILIGVGTGGFTSAFALQTEGSDVTKTRNPHNEYLMISVQTGIIGLALMLYLFYTQWKYAPLLPSALEQDAAKGLVLAYMANCSLNSALMDHADGLLFAFMTAVLFSSLKIGIKR